MNGFVGELNCVGVVSCLLGVLSRFLCGVGVAAVVMRVAGVYSTCLLVAIGVVGVCAGVCVPRGSGVRHAFIGWVLSVEICWVSPFLIASVSCRMMSASFFASASAGVLIASRLS
jgi:hypothetical protein